MTSQPKTIGQRRLALALVAAVSSLALPAPTSALAQAPIPVAASPIQAPNRNLSSAAVALEAVINVRADGLAETVETERIKILSPGAIQSEGQQSRSYIEGMETLDIQAYTEKPDGTRIPVDAANILTQDGASGHAAVFMRDSKIRTVLFREIAVGDTLVLRSRRVQNSGAFPGQFFRAIIFPLNLPITGATVTVVAPKGLTLNVGLYGENLDHQVIADETSTRHTISYHPQRRIMPEAGATSPLDRDPRIIVSTFESYEQLGRSFWAAIEAKAKPTEAIARLADQITAGITERRAQAEAIDHWIKQNIRYVGVYLGNGRWIAHDPDEVLKNKFGDCKDHAMLMTALLAAKGIASEQVLVNLGNVYTLPDAVTGSYFNHVIVYLPEFGMYDDPTATYASFGVLSRATYDKPVLHASAQGARLSHIPAMRAAEHAAVNRTRIAIAADGTVTGETVNTATGANALELRGSALQFEAIGLQTAAERVLQMLNAGSGSFEIDSPVDGATKYAIRGRFRLDAHIDAAPGKSFAIPRGMNVLARPGEFLLGQRLLNRHMPFVCSAGRQIEDIEVSFADGLPLPQAPKGIKIDKPYFTYTSDYRIENRTLKIRREFESRVTGQVCAPETEAAISDSLKAVQADVAIALTIPKAEAGVEPPKPPRIDSLLTNRNQCAGVDNAAADLRIGSCTALIQSGRETQTALAVAFVNRGFAYRMKGDNARALGDFEQAITLVPTYAVAFNWRGLARHSLHDYDGAIGDFNEAIRLNPMYSAAFSNRGSVRWDMGDRDAAMADFDQATQLDPVNAYAFQIRGRAYRIAGEFDRALADFDQMIRLQKNNAAAWNARCYTHLVAGSALAAALADCSEALRLSPNFVEALGNRGLALLRNNDNDRAIADYDAALRLAPKYAPALYGRAIAKLRKGDTDGGNADMAAATALNANIAKEFAKFGLAVATRSERPA